MDENQQNFDVKKIGGQEPANLNLEEPKKSVFSEALSNFFNNKKYLKIGIGVLVGLAVIGIAFIFIRGWFSFSKNKVEINIIAEEEVSSGEELKIIISSENNNRVDLKEAELIIDYPQGTYSPEGEELTQEIIEVGDVFSKDKNLQEIKIRLTGEEGSFKFLSARLNYKPTNINSRFESSTSFKININSVLIGLYLTAPQKAVSGEEISFSLDYINNTREDFSGLKIEFDYPAGFTFKVAEPAPEPNGEDNSWNIGDLGERERGTIKISGTFEGIKGENKALEVSLGKVENNDFLRYSQATSITQISASPLQVFLSLNEEEERTSVNFGEILNYKIDFRNNTDIALSQLVLKAHFKGKVFSFEKLALAGGGFFDSVNNTITWSAAGVPALALLPPGEAGEVSFSVPVKSNPPINNLGDKNFQISVQAELETLNVPPQFNLERLKIEKALSSKVNSSLSLRTKGYFNETTTDINNFGPIPPKVNQATSYTIHWQIANNSNDLEDIRVSAILPQGIKWENNYSTLGKGTEVQYNERTKQIVWEIEKISAATGVLFPAYELVFQVSLRPSITQVGTTPVLIDESQLEASDMFTGETIEAFSKAVATNLPDDPSVSQNEGRVAN